MRIHWIWALIILVIGYFIGSKYPGFIGKITGGAVAA